MCDIKKINRITEEFLNLTPEDVHQLIFEADSAELKEFYFLLNDYILQKKQAEVIKSGVY